MVERRVKRFYRDVSAGEDEGRFAVLLDGKPVKTPSGLPVLLPNRALAEAVAEEWRVQADTVDFTSMPLTRLVNTALERVPVDRAPVAEQALALGKSDLLCYRAEAPDALAARQAEGWDPLLEWLAENYGARLTVVQGVTFTDQPAEALLALEQAVWKTDDFALTGLSAAAAITGSLVLALALVVGRLDAGEAFRLATLDEAFQAEQWGMDVAAKARLDELEAELTAVERLLRLL
jgi:chaperone required for assembly of F1-ATPase